jgi:hypothetical protein
MKNKLLNHTIFSLIVITGLIILFSFHNNVPAFEPVLMTRESMEAAVQLRSSRDIGKPGKIWVYDNYIFVIEQYKGIHIIDNTNSSAPDNLGFIQVDGCTDVAVKDGLIYANNAVDLIGIKPDLAAKTIVVKSRSRNVLPELLPPDGSGIERFEKFRPKGTIIVRYEPYKQ